MTRKLCGPECFFWESRAAARKRSRPPRGRSRPSLIRPVPLMAGHLPDGNGRAAEAIPKIKQAIRLDPRAHIFVRYLLIGYSLTFLGQYDDAIPWFQKSLAANPNDSAVIVAILTPPLPPRRRLQATLRGTPERGRS